MSECHDTEEWRAIPGFDGWYDVSNLGRVRSYRNRHWKYLGVRRTTPIVLRGSGQPYEYRMVLLRHGGVGKTYRIHLLVLESFVGSRPDGMVARHLNDEKHDNRLDNLKWGTEVENRADATRNCRAPVGSDHGNAKLTEIDVREMRAIAGVIGRRKIAKLFGVSLRVACRIIDGEDWKHVVGARGKNAPRAKIHGRPRVFDEREHRIVRRLYDFITQDEIAELMGVSQAAISQVLKRQDARNGDYRWQRQKHLVSEAARQWSMS